jgi:hypothetical protein
MITDRQIQELVATLSIVQRAFVAKLLESPFNEVENERLLVRLWELRCSPGGEASDEDSTSCPLGIQ